MSVSSGVSPMVSPGKEKHSHNPHSHKVPDAVANALHHVKEFMTDSQKAHTMLKEGKLLMEQGNIQGAIDCYNEGINFQPLVPLFTNRATCHRIWSMFSEAYFDYSFAIRMEPENGSLYCLRGVALSKMKKIAMALEDLDIGCKMEASSANFFCRGTVYADIGQYEHAIKDLTRAISEDQCTMDLRLRCLHRRALAYFENNNYGDCITDLKEVLKNDPNSIPPRVLLGNALKMISELKAAEENLAHAIMLDSKSAPLYMERGDIRYRTGQSNKIMECIYDFDAAVRLLSEHQAEAAASNSPLHHSPSKSNKHHGRIGGHRVSSVAHASHSAHSDHSSVSSNDTLTSKSGGRAHRNAVMGGVVGSGGGVLLHTLNPENRQNSSCSVSSFGKDKSNQLEPESATVVKDAGEQLAEAYFRRAQAKLLLQQLQNSDVDIVHEALEDAKMAVKMIPTDNDFHLVVVVCYIRLQKLTDAKELLDQILARDPNNEKALFHSSYVNRQNGRLKDAIANLSKIIAYYDSYKKASSFPISRIYETRGTLFHQLQAHSFALTDFGRAVGLDPEKATNYYLRGDCHGKLGNYELAIQDYNTADEKGFDDMVSLCMARGTLNRLIGQYRAATKDFDRALNHLKSVRGDGMLAIRIQLLRALCLIDVKKHARACQILLQAFDMLKTRNMSFSPIKEVLDTDDESDGSDDDLPLFNPSLDFEDKSANPSARPTLATPKPTSAGAVSTNVNTTGHLNKISVQHNLLNSRKINASQRHLNTFQDPDEMKGLYFRESENWTRENALKLEWTVQYHISLTLYMQKKYYEAAESLEICTGDLVKYSPDTLSYGVTLFFLGVSYTILKNWELAEKNLTACLNTSWAVSAPHNTALVYFARGKQYQCQGLHDKAIVEFTGAIEEEPENAYAMFRRAWSYKATNQFSLAGNDFEESKRLKPNDPNFAIEYKKIYKFEYMEIDTEPDLIEPFPPLLPVPGAL